MFVLGDQKFFKIVSNKELEGTAVSLHILDGLAKPTLEISHGGAYGGRRSFCCSNPQKLVLGS